MADKRRWHELILPLGVIACLLVILVPLPPQVLDLLLAANIVVAVIVLLTTIYVRTPLEFAIFPTLLLTTTLSRLVLNIATTRLILSRGASDNVSAAGGVIQSFGEFVAGNQVTVGLIIFAIIIIVQFLVITKGSTRISEVAARFTLDSMPGRQMAIDSELKSNAIDQETARKRRDELQQQADFYGAMDGASKFVRGDAIAGLLITAINLIGGLAIGLTSGMSIAQAGDTFSKLTIGDGLATQIPGLLISLAAGILITRSSRQVNLPGEFISQTFARPQVLVIAGLFSASLIFTQLPSMPLIAIAIGCIGLAWITEKQSAEKRKQQAAKTQQKESKDVTQYLNVDPIELELGVGLIGLANTAGGGKLLEEITRARKATAETLGIVLPKVRVRDNLQLDQNEYRLLINRLPAANGHVHTDRVLALGRSGSEIPVEGLDTDWPEEPQAKWILAHQANRLSGDFQLLRPEAVISHHIESASSERAAQLLTRQATAYLLEQIRNSSPSLLEGFIPEKMSVAKVQMVLQVLLSERVSIRHLEQIIETISNHYGRATDPHELAELVRLDLAEWICADFGDDNQVLRSIELVDELQIWARQKQASLKSGNHNLSSDPSVIQFCYSLQSILVQCSNQPKPPVLLVKPAIRSLIRRMVAEQFPHLGVLSYGEITSNFKIEKIAVLHRATLSTLPPDSSESVTRYLVALLVDLASHRFDEVVIITRTILAN